MDLYIWVWDFNVCTMCQMKLHVERNKHWNKYFICLHSYLRFLPYMWLLSLSYMLVCICLLALALPRFPCNRLTRLG